MAPEDERNSCDSFHLQVFLFWGTNQLRNRPQQIRFVLSTTNRFWGAADRFPGNSCSSGRSRGLRPASRGRRRSVYAWGKCTTVAAQVPGADGRVGGASRGDGPRLPWIPAFAGMTGGTGRRSLAVAGATAMWGEGCGAATAGWPARRLCGAWVGSVASVRDIRGIVGRMVLYGQREDGTAVCGAHGAHVEPNERRGRDRTPLPVEADRSPDPISPAGDLAPNLDCAQQRTHWHN